MFILFFFFEEKYKYNLELCCWKQGIEWRSSGKWKRKGSRKKEMEENSWEKKGKRKIRAIRKKKIWKRKWDFGLLKKVTCYLTTAMIFFLFLLVNRRKRLFGFLFFVLFSSIRFWLHTQLRHLYRNVPYPSVWVTLSVESVSECRDQSTGAAICCRVSSV